MPRRTVYAAFAVFGGLWGAWGASLPAIRDQAGITDGELGTALLFVGAGAVPAMLLAGRALDRRPHRTTAVLLVVLGAAGVLAAVAGRGLSSLAIALAVLGAASGAADVAINTAAGAAQREHGGAVITRAHASFSAAVVVASLVTGLARAADLPIVVPFAAVALAALALAARFAAMPDARAESRAEGVLPRGATDARRAASEARRSLRGSVSPRTLLAIGALGALAFAVENAHQSWSALYLRDVIGSGPATAAAGPAIFAAVVAVTRFSAGGISAARPVALIAAGAVVAAAGTVLVAAASSLGVALAGLAIAAAGAAVLFPSLLILLTRRVPDHVRGSATSAVTAVAYMGFLAGPAYVGAWADATSLPTAMLAVAALAAVLALLTPVLARQRVPSRA
jgi:predicted MFS family arabinose efflux permease